MCVIIIREPKVEIPFDKLELACDINKHGYGIAWVHNNRVRVEYSIEQPNDPKKVQERLNALSKFRVFLHLRHATVGAVQLSNAHPLKVLSKDSQDGMDLVLFHNGTIHDWKPTETNSTVSDTRNFVDGFVRPLATRIKESVGYKKLVDDQIFKWCLKREIGGWSKVVLLDNYGSYTLLGNNKEWKDFDGWRASNEYSFQSWHSRSSTKPSYTTGTNTGRSANAGWWENELNGWDDNIPFDATGDKGSSALPFRVQTRTKPSVQAFDEWAKKQLEADPKTTAAKDQTKYGEEIAKVSNVIWTSNVTKNSIKEVKFEMVGVKRKSFKEETYIDDIDQVANLTPEQFAELCETCPLAMAQLFIDMFAERETLRGNTATNDLSQSSEIVRV
jgi:hypothetical protein